MGTGVDWFGKGGGGGLLLATSHYSLQEQGGFHPFSAVWLDFAFKHRTVAARIGLFTLYSPVLTQRRAPRLRHTAAQIPYPCNKFYS
jgi:hypothetical protein